ncbi:MAG: KUP/HAK/KT family potassium transporter [Steroidobacteraceae bacterium]
MSENRALLPATLGALGVVYGDIGTSPLYAFKEAVAAAGGAQAGEAAVMGVLSLIVWSTLLVVTIKYVFVILRADNEGEGGVLSLLALVQRKIGTAGPWARRALALGVLGTALFSCDALITPAISVLSAVEGLALLDPGFERAVVPVTLAIIVVLFSIQRFGTERVGKAFGPVMMIWFATLAALGLRAILWHPQVLAAVNPMYGATLLLGHPGLALLILGSVFLTLTGAEALYTDMGHFGRAPVRLGWFAFVWPALLLNYFGQGSLVLESRSPVEMPFFGLAPQALLPAMVVLATAATIIASQAVISGAFSVTRQAVQLDLLPRVRILQTSETELGQIYVPLTNGFMAFSVIAFVLMFGSSSALASAYGVSVVGDMCITTLLGAVLALVVWRWQKWRVLLLFGTFLAIDLSFLTGNLSKIAQGGWIPLLLAGVMFAIFIVWRDGRVRLRAELEHRAVPMTKLPELLASATRVPGTGVFLVSHAGFVPTALLRNLEHNKVAHERIVILHLQIVRTPRHDPANRLRIDTLMPDVLVIGARFGFMETPDVGEVLRGARSKGLRIHPGEVSYFLGWHLVRAIPRPGWSGLKMRAFAWLQRRSAQATDFFRMPTRGVVVLATDVEL